MMTETEIMEYFNSPDRHRTDSSFPKCTMVKRDHRSLYAEFLYSTGFEYCCFEWGCNIGNMEELIANPDFGIDSVELRVTIEKGARYSDKRLDNLRKNTDTYHYTVHSPDRDDE